MTRGTEGVADLGTPFIPWHDLNSVGNFISCYESLRSNFDRHIATNIPGYYEVQAIKGSILTDILNLKATATILDIGSSEGSFVKTICALAASKVSAVGLEPNPQMYNSFYQLPSVDRVECALAAFSNQSNEGQVWHKVSVSDFELSRISEKLEIEGDEIVIRYFKPDRKFNIVHESETFQFISKDREFQVARIKDFMVLGGLAIFEEKFSCDPAEYMRNEVIKDGIFKNRFYSEEYILKKNEQIQANGPLAMLGNQIRYDEMEAILKRHFKHVCRYWLSGNFRGYAASDNKKTIQEFYERMPTDENLVSKIKPVWVKY